MVDNLDHFLSVRVCKENEGLAHRLIQGNILRINRILLLNLAIVINAQQDFLWLSHVIKHDLLDFSQDLRVDVGVHEGGGLVGLVLHGQVQSWDLLRLEVLLVRSLLHHDVISKEVPEVKADLEEFLILNAAHLRQICQTL